MNTPAVGNIRETERNLVVKKGTIQAWAARNAGMLIFLSVMFFITWVWIAILVT